MQVNFNVYVKILLTLLYLWRKSESGLARASTPCLPHLLTWLDSGYTFSNTLYDASSLMAQNCREWHFVFPFQDVFISTAEPRGYNLKSKKKKKMAGYKILCYKIIACIRKIQCCKI